MTMDRFELRMVPVAAALALLVVGTSAQAKPAPPADDECVAACMQEAEACIAPFKEAADACIVDAGCPDLRAAAMVACDEDRSSQACADARTALRACVAPCKQDQKDGISSCREASLTCLRDECGLEGLPPRCRPKRSR